MPELPEVEVTRRGLAAPLLGATVQAVRLGKPLRWPLGIAPDALVGTRVGALQRRGKYIWMPLALPGQPPGDPAGGVLLHLGMSGSLRLFEAPQGAALPAEVPAPGVHDHFEMVTDHGTLRLNDPRRFGAVVWSAGLTTAPAATLLARLGVEPLEAGFTARQLHDALRGRRVAIKQALLAGDVVVGVGNIYCSEALFLAGIDPRTPAGELDMARCERLVAAVREVLTRALSAGGSTLRNFRDAHGMGGAFQTIAKVYDRAGEPCVACGTAIRRLVQGQRATYHCPTCQRR